VCARALSALVELAVLASYFLPADTEAMISLALLAVMLLLLPFAIRATTKKRDPSRGLRWQGIRWAAPDEAEAMLRQGIAKQKSGDLSGALVEYNRALALRRTATALNNRGCALLEAGEIEQALTDLREAIALDPDSATAHCSLAEGLARAGDHSAALASLKRAAALDPSWRAYARTADIFADLRATEEGGRWVDGSA
jgi:tetratricopeptide (TPR) repeat protein